MIKRAFQITRNYKKKTIGIKDMNRQFEQKGNK